MGRSSGTPTSLVAYLGMVKNCVPRIVPVRASTEIKATKGREVTNTGFRATTPPVFKSVIPQIFLLERVSSGGLRSPFDSTTNFRKSARLKGIPFERPCPLDLDPGRNQFLMSAMGIFRQLSANFLPQLVVQPTI